MQIIAGLTVGAVVVPQSMSYALLAFMGPEYGLYSSFVGVFIYCFFATSKDVTIGVSSGVIVKLSLNMNPTNSNISSACCCDDS